MTASAQRGKKALDDIFSVLVYDEFSKNRIVPEIKRKIKGFNAIHQYTGSLQEMYS